MNSRDDEKALTGNLNSWLWLWASIIFLIGLVAVMASELIESSRIVQILLHEIGFALIVASVVWFIFERISESHSERVWKRRSEKIAEDVFYGVLRRRLPKELLVVANELILAQDVIRKELCLSWEIFDGTAELNEICGFPVVRLDTRVSYRLLNISERPKTHQIVLSLPNPTLRGDHKLPMLSGVVIRQGDQLLAPAETLLSQALCNRKEEDSRVIFNIASINLPADSDAFIAIEYSLLKYENDTDLFQTVFPADSISISIRDHRPGARLVGVRALHRDKLTVERCLPDKGVYEYKLPKFFLPHQGVIVWWNKQKPRS
ncbi:MAG TPA: hypothetical protein VNZ48_23085 [Xanthobacteraceae bacterium]|jgi:hypothetical protein|nr:hypothetical protein [Xanthobacteraceae bacterium]